MKVEMVDGTPIPPEVRNGWESILKKNPFRNPFLTPLWTEIWLEHFGKNLKPKLFLFREDNGLLQGLGYFLESSSGGKKGFALLGSQDVWDYRDFIVLPGKEAEVFQSFAFFLEENSCNLIELDSIAESSPTLKRFPSILETFGFQTTQEVEEIVLNLSLPPTWDEFLQGLTAKDRHELRRKIRRAEKEGTCEWVRVEDPALLGEKMGAFFDLHRKSRHDKSEFMTPEMESFFRDLGGVLFAKGWLDLSFLRIGGKEVAAFFSMDFDGVQFVYNSGYDPAFSWYSPGIVLAAHCIRGAIERGMKGFNFLRGREDYKYNLGGREEANYRLRAERV